MRLLSLFFLFLLVPRAAGADLPWPDTRALAPTELVVVGPEGIRRDTVDNAKRDGLVVVDLSDD